MGKNKNKEEESDEISLKEIQIIETDMVLNLSGIFVALMIPIMIKIDDYIIEREIILVLLKIGYNFLLVSMLIGIFLKILFKNKIQGKAGKVEFFSFIYLLGNGVFLAFFIAGIICIFSALFMHTSTMAGFSSIVDPRDQIIYILILCLSTVLPFLGVLYKQNKKINELAKDSDDEKEDKITDSLK